MNQYWKKDTRKLLFNWLPKGLYIKVLPIYFRLVNRQRSNCPYYFSLDENRNVVIHNNDKKEFVFYDHRRLNRYFLPNGLQRIQDVMLKKYSDDHCYIEKGDVVVEIGANIGEFTIAAANIAKQIYAFEPDPNCLDCLEKNVQKFSNVEIVRMGASEENGKKVFFLSSEDADSSFIKPKTYSDRLEIEAIRLDTWMDKTGVDYIDFLKVEAEGAELEVLKGLGNKIRQVNKISVDGGPEREGKPTYKMVAEYLKENNFKVHVNRYQVNAHRN